MAVRINKYLSEAGVCSRREADRMLDQGRISIDGIPALPGQKVEDGQCVTTRRRKRSFLRFISRVELSVQQQTPRTERRLST